MKVLLKITSIVLLTTITVLSLSACGNNKPSVNITAEMLSVTDQQFQSIGTSAIDNPSKDDFKIFKFRLDEQNSNNVKNRNIVVPNFIQVFGNSRDNLYWIGQSSIQDNINENFAKYSYDITLYTRGLDEDSLREILNSEEVVVSWTTENGQQKEKRYKIGDLVEFK